MKQQLINLAIEVNDCRPRTQETENLIDKLLRLINKDSVKDVELLEVQHECKYGWNFLKNPKLYIDTFMDGDFEEGKTEIETPFFDMVVYTTVYGRDTYSHEFMTGSSEATYEITDIIIHELDENYEWNQSHDIELDIINQVNKQI